MKKVYLIMWGYRGDATDGVVRAFTHRAAADVMLGILTEQSDVRKYHIVECELVGDFTQEG